MIRKFLILPPILIGVAVIAYFISQRQAPEIKPPDERARHVRVIEAPQVQIVPRLLGYGTVRPEKVWNASAQVSGEVVYVHPNFKKGAILPEGTEIIRISPADYELAIAQAEANIRASDAKLTELQVSEQNTRLTLEIEQRGLDLREKELARKQSLLKSGTVAQSAVDQESRDTLTQRQKVQELNNALRLIPTQQTVEAEQKAVFQSQLEAARLDLQRTSITVPFDARIAEANVEITQFVQVGQTLAVADGVKVAEIDAQVPIARLRQLTSSLTDSSLPVGVTPETFEQMTGALGFKVIVRLRTGDKSVEWTGRFARISDTIDPNTRTVGIIAAVDGAYAKAVPGARPPLAKGMFVEVELSAKPTPERLIVPRSALHDERLYIVTADNRLDIRPVETGLTQGAFVEIAKGLKAGEQVVVSDLNPAIAGMLLRTTVDAELHRELLTAAAGEGPLK